MGSDVGDMVQSLCIQIFWRRGELTEKLSAWRDARSLASPLEYAASLACLEAPPSTSCVHVDNTSSGAKMLFVSGPVEGDDASLVACRSPEAR